MYGVQENSYNKLCFSFYASLSLVNEDHNKEYPLTKFKQFSKCGFGEISSQPLTASSYIRTR